MTIIRSLTHKIFFPIFILWSIFSTFNARSQTNNFPTKNYRIITDTIIDKIIKLSDIYPQLDGISASCRFEDSLNSCNHIYLDWRDAQSKRLPASDYYLLFHLDFYICTDNKDISLADSNLSIGNMKISLSIFGKGNEELEEAVRSIINEEQKKINSK
jgi:hypothetical protein